MTERTIRHIAVGFAWLVVPLVLAVALNLVGLMTDGFVRRFGALSSLLWSAGFAGIFCSWAIRDGPAHGKSRSSAITFAASCLLLSVLAVVPYLYYTRGFRQGTVASLKFLSLFIAFGIFFLGVSFAIGRAF